MTLPPFGVPQLPANHNNDETRGRVYKSRLAFSFTFAILILQHRTFEHEDTHRGVPPHTL
jgi:hypothetical protein